MTPLNFKCIDIGTMGTINKFGANVSSFSNDFVYVLLSLLDVFKSYQANLLKGVSVSFSLLIFRVSIIDREAE